MIGKTIGPYEFVERLASGGMGVVYRAEHHTLRVDRAIKLIRPDRAYDREARERFLREARAAAGLDHPNIGMVHDIGETEDGLLYIVMTLYRGETLRARLNRGVVGVDEAHELVRQLAAGLSAAHSARVVHRDLKPDNIMLVDGNVRILDFGLALVKTDGRTTASFLPTPSGTRLGTYKLHVSRTGTL